MNVAILGLGNFGRSLVDKLYQLGHTITAVDLDPKAVALVQNHCDRAVVADCTDREALKELGLPLMDAAVISMADNMGASLLATLFCKEMHLPKVVCKADNADHEKILDKLGADQVIFPERDAARGLALSLTNPGLLEYLPLSDEFSIMELAASEDMLGKTLVELDLRRSKGINVIAMKETDPERIHVLVDPTYTIKSGDVLVVIGSSDKLAGLRKGPEKKEKDRSTAERPN